MAVTLFIFALLPVPYQSKTIPISNLTPLSTVFTAPKVPPSVFPDMRDNYYQTIVKPSQDAQEARQRIEAQEVIQTTTVAPEVVVAPVDTSSDKAFIYSHESGNNPSAINQTSGACGLGQALPCVKLPCGLTDYTCQDNWFTNSYMIPRYSTWQRARAFWLCLGYCSNNYGTVYKVKTWW